MPRATSVWRESVGIEIDDISISILNCGRKPGGIILVVTVVPVRTAPSVSRIYREGVNRSGCVDNPRRAIVFFRRNNIGFRRWDD